MSSQDMAHKILLFTATVFLLFGSVVIPNNSGNTQGILKIEPYNVQDVNNIDTQSLQWRKRRAVPRGQVCDGLSETDDLKCASDWDQTFNDTGLVSFNSFGRRQLNGRNDYITIGAFTVCARPNGGNSACSSYGIGSDVGNNSDTRQAIINSAAFLNDAQRDQLYRIDAFKVIGPVIWTVIILYLFAGIILIWGYKAKVTIYGGSAEGEKDPEKAAKKIAETSAKFRAESIGKWLARTKTGLFVFTLGFLLGNITTLFTIDEAWDKAQRINILFVTQSSANGVPGYRATLDVVYKLLIAAWALSAAIIGLWLRDLHSGVNYMTK